MSPYHCREEAPEGILEGYSPLMRSLLFHRGVTKDADAETFLNPRYEKELHDPFLMTDMEKAVTRIRTAMREGEHITIYSDYDCDGIPGGVLLHDFLHALSYEHFDNYIPHRHTEGYGFNTDAVDVLLSRGTKLIVTVDCGITDNESIAYAQEKGIDVIVTDHHEVGEVLPPAYAVLNPKRTDDNYPFPHLCGSGVAFKLVTALLMRGRAEGDVTLVDGFEKWWLDVVGLATIADMVPLHGENRVLAHYGLKVLQKTRRPGLQHLLKKARVPKGSVSEDDVGFTIAPRINAASRMDTPEDAFKMLALKDEGEASAHVRHLEKLNNERKGVVAAMVKDIKKRINEMPERKAVMVLGNPSWRPSLVGLAANTIVEEYQCPAFVWGRDGRGVIKGSCRSDGVSSVVDLMRATENAFIEFGGHHASGGFSVHDEHIHTLSDAINEAYQGLLKDTEVREANALVIDGEVLLEDIYTVYKECAPLAPFGEGNPKPLFCFKKVTPARIEVFGKTKNHTKLVFDVNGRNVEAIGFFKTPGQYNLPEVGTPFDLIAHIESSSFMGRQQIRLRIVEVVSPQ